MTASRTMIVNSIHRCEDVGDCEGLEVILAGVSGAATVGAINVGSEPASANRVEPSSKQKFSESSLYLLLQLGHRFMESWIGVEAKDTVSYGLSAEKYLPKFPYFPFNHTARKVFAAPVASVISSIR